jgi:hypothetical protein
VGKIQKVFEVLELRAAVVEAARECVTDSYRPTPEYDRLRWDRLHKAVEALEKAEGKT